MTSALTAFHFIDWVFQNRGTWIGGALNLNGSVGHVSLLERAIECFFGRENNSVERAMLSVRELQKWLCRYRLVLCDDKLVTRVPAIAILSNDEALNEFLQMYPAQERHRQELVYWMNKANPSRTLLVCRAAPTPVEAQPSNSFFNS